MAAAEHVSETGRAACCPPLYEACLRAVEVQMPGLGRVSVQMGPSGATGEQEVENLRCVVLAAVVERGEHLAKTRSELLQAGGFVGVEIAWVRSSLTERLARAISQLVGIGGRLHLAAVGLRGHECVDEHRGDLDPCREMTGEVCLTSDHVVVYCHWRIL